MKIPGLHQIIAQKRSQACDCARKARNPETDPREAYEAAEQADRLTGEAEKFAEHLKSNDQLIEGIEQLIHYLQQTNLRTRARELCLAELEAASGRLRRENGDPEPARNFKAVATPKTNGQAVS